MAEKSRESISGNIAAWRRFAPPAGFVLALMLLVVFCYDASYSALPPTEKRYVKAKKQIDELRADAKRGNLRQPWEDLIREFKAIYECDPAWPNRPAALFRAAESLEELSHRSYRAADMHRAAACYEDVAARHPKSCLADDALYRAAQMRAVWLKDDAGALTLLRRIQKKYPDGDMADDAAAFERVITAAGKGKTSSEAGPAVRAASREVREDVPLSPPQDTRDAGRRTLAKTPIALIPAADIPARYADAKKRMAALFDDKSRSRLRQPWQALQNEFFLIATSVKKMTNLSKKSPLQAIGGGAQYRAAACNDAIAAASGLTRDHAQSQDLYVSVADTWPKSALADDALLRAAVINAEKLDRHENTRLLLERIIATYPAGDMTAQAKTMLAKEAEAGKRRTAALPNRPVLNGISWNSPSRDRVEILLEMNAPAEWQARIEKVGPKRAPQLVVSLNGVQVSKNAGRGVKIRDSLLTEIGIAPQKNASVLRFDLRGDSRYAIRRDEKNGIHISLAAAAEQKPALPAISRDRVRGTKVNDMARQLGLSVHTVFIDAGHGGRDPGTSHNGILERSVSLDVAKMLGRLLEANGLQVVYSRTEDIALPLSRRTALANAAKADLFVSVHVNANDDTSVQGIETYYLDLARSPQAARVAALENAGSDRRLGDMQTVLADVMLNARVDESQRLAHDVQRLTISRLKRSKTPARSNGIKSAPFHVLIGAQMPAILVEIGYCTNEDEAARLKSQRYRLHLAEGLAEGILAYRDRLLHRHVAGNSLTTHEAGAI
ncbi:MAG: N-acetylmuramoyl-L-alanine amidase [Desulfovibrio sp.]|nr:N-acetylmuramoyl-L-alanine amidase [Desulfovibrio sp.]